MSKFRSKIKDNVLYRTSTFRTSKPHFWSLELHGISLGFSIIRVPLFTFSFVSHAVGWMKCFTSSTGPSHVIKLKSLTLFWPFGSSLAGADNVPLSSILSLNASEVPKTLRPLQPYLSFSHLVCHVMAVCVQQLNRVNSWAYIAHFPLGWCGFTFTHLRCSEQGGQNIGVSTFKTFLHFGRFVFACFSITVIFFFLTTVTNHRYSPLHSSRVTVQETQEEEGERGEESQSFWSREILFKWSSCSRVPGRTDSG